MAFLSPILLAGSLFSLHTHNLYSPTYSDPMKEAKEMIEIFTPRPVWPPDSELNGRESILVGYLTSGDAHRRITMTGQPFFESQTAFYSDGALSLAIEEINNSTELLPDHMVS